MEVEVAAFELIAVSGTTLLAAITELVGVGVGVGVTAEVGIGVEVGTWLLLEVLLLEIGTIEGVAVVIDVRGVIDATLKCGNVSFDFLFSSGKMK